MSHRLLWTDPAVAPIPAKRSTALLLIHSQYGYRNVAHFGTGISNPNYEANISSLIASFREKSDGCAEGQSPLIIHVQYRAPWTDSLFFAEHKGPYGLNREEKRGLDFIECSVPRLWNDEEQKFVYIEQPEERPLPAGFKKTEQSEIIMTSHGHSVFINTPLEFLLNKHGIKTLLIAGMALDSSVSTAVRMAQNLALTGKWGGRGNMEDAAEADLWTNGEGLYLEAPEEIKSEENGGFLVEMPRIVLVEDATRTFGQVDIDAEVVHKVHIKSLDQFAELRTTDQVLKAFQ